MSVFLHVCVYVFDIGSVGLQCQSLQTYLMIAYTLLHLSLISQCLHIVNVHLPQNYIIHNMCPPLNGCCTSPLW